MANSMPPAPPGTGMPPPPPRTLNRTPPAPPQVTKPQAPPAPPTTAARPPAPAIQPEYTPPPAPRQEAQHEYTPPPAPRQEAQPEIAEAEWSEGEWTNDTGQELTPAAPQSLPVPAAIDFDRMSFQQIAEAQGLLGLDFNQYGVLPICALNHGSFRLNNGTNLGTDFNCIVHDAKPKYLYKTSVPDNDPRHAVAYSYDQTSSNGKPVRDILDEWARQGMGYDVKNYLELTCRLDDGRIILLSVPPTSVSRFTNHVITVTSLRKLISQVRTHVFIAPEVTKVRNPFTPIGFEIAN